MRLPITFLLVALLVSMHAAAQNQISGNLQDANGKALGFATVTLLQASDSTLVRGAFSTEDGSFSFENIPDGAYCCGFAMVGFEPQVSQKFVLSKASPRVELAPVALHESAGVLSEVTVVAKRPFLEQKIDRTIVNVANSITNAGGTALQVLQRSPGVQVNTLTKNISLAGKQGVQVMINGKITRLPADAVVDMLAGMNADNIDRIELIHTPPANFEAEGNAGIINIVLKNTGDQGLNGGYSAKAGYGRDRKYGAGLYFNYRKKRANIFGNYDLDHNLNPQVFTNYRVLQQGADYLETDTYSDRPHTPTTTQNARLGVDFQLSKKTVLGVLGTFFDRDWYMEAVNHVKYSSNGKVDSLLKMPNDEINHNRSFSGNVNLTHQISANQSLSLDADFINYDISNPSHYTLEHQDAAGNPTAKSELQISKNTPIRVGVLKADYNLSLNEQTRLESGLKFTSMRFTNDVRVERRSPLQPWQTIPEYTSVSRLDEDVLGAFASFSTKLGEKTDLKAGLRYEHTNTQLDSGAQVLIVDRHYGSWFPSVFLTQKISETQSINLSYSRRISRPPIRRLAPWLIFSDPTTLEGGNPALQPAFTDALNLNYSFKAFQLGVSYSIEKNTMSFVPKVDPATNRQFNAFENLDNRKVLSANLYMPFRPAKWWDMGSNFYLNYSEINGELVEGQALKIQNLSWGASCTNTFRLPRKFTLEISGNYDAPAYWGIAYWQATGSLNFGLEKDFGSQWGKLRLSANDIFMSSNWFGETNQPDVNLFVKSSYQFAERVFMLSWSNTFGNQKLKSSRQRQAASAEEMRRI